MKKKWLIIPLLLLVLVLVLTGCTTTESNTQANTPTNTAAPVVQPTATASSLPAETASVEIEPVSREVTMTLQELSQYNGKDGNPAYIAVDGTIYDVTNVSPWNGGTHNGFVAGQDLTEEIKNVSPHGISKLSGLPVIGTLIN